MNQQFQLPRIMARDLTDVSCAKINSIFDLLAKQIASSQGALGDLKYDVNLTAKSVKLTRATAPLPNDTVMYKELDALVSVSTVDTHANRPTYSAAVYDGKFYYESDRKYIYLSDGTNWNYMAGIYHGATRPSDLAANDVGALFYDTTTKIQYYWSGTFWAYDSGVFRAALSSIPTPSSTEAGYLFEATDYAHMYIWDGASWGFASGDSGSGYIVAGQGNSGLWALCDGTITTVANANGTTSNTTTPDLTGDVFLQGASSTSAVKVSTRATWEAAAKTDDEAAHTHNYDPGGASTNQATAQVTISNGAGATIYASDPLHSHVVVSTTLSTGVGTAHSHVLSDANAQLKKFDELNGGLPKRIALAWYMRR